MIEQAKRMAMPSELKERKALIPLRDIALDYGAIVASILLFVSFQNAISLVVAIIISGVFIYRLQIIAHDGLHYALANNKTLNDFLTRWILLAPQFTPMTLNRKNHLNHHGRFASEYDKDWQYYKSADKDTRSKFYKWFMLVFGFGFVFKIAFKLFGLDKNAKVQKVKESNPPGFGEDLLAIAIMQVLIFTAFYATLGWPYYFLIWCLAVFGVMVPLNTLRSFAEHSIPEPDNSAANRLFTYGGGFLELFVLAPHNMNYHYEHHEYMYIPYYNLPRLKKLLQESDPTYTQHIRISYLNHIRNYFKSLPILGNQS